MKSISTLPSTLIYSLDVPEPKNFESKFFYNFHVIDELINDTGEISQQVKDLYKISNSIAAKSKEGTLEKSELPRIPRYALLTFASQYKNDVILGSINPSTTDQNIINDVVFEENFASDYYTKINIDNQTIEQLTSTIVDVYNIFYYNENTKTTEKFKTFDKIIKNVSNNFDDNSSIYDYASEISSMMLQNGGIQFAENLIEGSRFSSAKKLTFDVQINNNVIYDLFLYASGSHLSNNEFYKENLEFSKSLDKNPKFSISDEEFKPSIKTYQDGIEPDNSSVGYYSEGSIKKTLLGFYIEKFELQVDGNIKKFDPVILRNSEIKSYVDTKIRYGAIYVYKIRTLFEIEYPAVDTDTLNFKIVRSIIASKPLSSYIETIEMIAPPPPVELRFVWDYDRFNLNTVQFLPNTNIPLENTGVRGSLMIYWSFPTNRQLDIKKFQIFRRKSIDEPFELIKMFDFDDSIIKMSNLESSINQNLIVTSRVDRGNGTFISVPVMNYYDDDFLKTSEYIYAVAAIDAHGLTSNYSEQIKVSFDVFENKLKTSIVSISGAPKQYPNLYLNAELFLDTIKIMNKKVVNVYFSPSCYDVKFTHKNNNQTKVKVIDYSDNNLKYFFNFINVDKALGRNLKVNLKNVT